MKVCMIHGQNHKGSTYHMSRLLVDQLPGAQVSEFFLPRDLNHFCLGCYSCVEEEEKCPYWQDKKPILEAMERAELLVFTSPNYCMAPSAPMKSLLDLMFDCWMVHRPKAWMFQKRAVILSTSAGAGCGGVIRVIRSSLRYWGVPVIHAYGTAVGAKNWGEVKADKKARIQREMARLARKLDCSRKPRVGVQTRVLFRVMGMMHRAGWDSSPVERQYWEERGWLQGGRPWKEER